MIAHGVSRMHRLYVATLCGRGTTTIASVVCGRGHRRHWSHGQGHRCRGWRMMEGMSVAMGNGKWIE